jgi:hypothetical protein
VLPAEDEAYLKAKGFRYEVTAESNFLCLVLFDYRLPGGYVPHVVDLLLRLAAGWPDSKPDMFWVAPPVTYGDGRQPPSSQHMETHLGRPWQRFSRHVPDGAWRAGDGLEAWLTKIRDILDSEVPK